MISIAEEMRRDADAAKIDGRERIVFSMPINSAYVVADCIERYMSEQRKVCFVCDQIRDAPIEALADGIGILTYLVADLGILIESLPPTDAVTKFRRANASRLRVSSELIKSVRTNRIGSPREPGQEG